MAYNHRLPTPEELTEDTICYPLYLPNSDYFREILLGALRESILADRHYQRDDELTALTVRDYYRNVTYLPLVQAMIDETPCSTPPELGKEPGQCFEYSPRAPFIKWVNYNPFTNNEPIPLFRDFPIDIVPDFIAIPPWITYTGPIGETIAKVIDFFKLFGGQEISLAALVGYQFGDVFTTLAQADVALKNEEGQFKLPGFDIEVSGAGVVEIELLAVPFGGLAYVALDENNADPQSLLDVAELFISGADPDEETVDVNRDITQLPQESAESTITEIEITEPGDHTIYVRFLPAFNDSITPLGFGGGLRRVGLCGAVVPRGEDYDGEKITEENIVTTPTELEQSLYNALKRRDCDCCGGGDAGGGDAGGGGNDTDGDGLDDETGQPIITTNEAKAGQAKQLATEFLEYLYKTWQYGDTFSNVVDVEVRIDLAYDVADATGYATDIRAMSDAAFSAGGTAAGQAALFAGSPGAAGRADRIDELSEILFCEGFTRQAIGEFIAQRLDTVSVLAETLSLVLRALQEPTDTQLAEWQATPAPDDDYLTYDCYIRPSWSKAVTAAEIAAITAFTKAFTVGTAWNTFNEVNRRVKWTASGKITGLDANGNAVVVDWFYRKVTNATTGEVTITRRNYTGAPPFRAVINQPSGTADLLVNTGLPTYEESGVYTGIGTLGGNVGGQWTIEVAKGVKDEFSGTFNGSVKFTLADTGAYG